MTKFIDVASTADINMKFGIISVLMIFNTVLIYYLFIKFIGSFTNNEKWDKDLELTPCILFPYGKNLWERVKPNYQKRYTITERKSMVRSMRLFFWTVILNVLQVFIFFNLFKLFYWDSPTWLTASTAFGINIAYAIMIISGVAFGLFGGVALWGYLLLVFLLLTETSIIKQLITILFTHVVKWKNKAIVYGWIVNI